MPFLCPECGTANSPGIAVCAHCAQPLSNVCPQCGLDNPTTSKFCGNCGANLFGVVRKNGTDPMSLQAGSGFIPVPFIENILREGKQIEGERRSVTVLFSDLVGFTSISERLDPEAVYTFINTIVNSFRDEIYSHEGTLDKFMGDGVMAFFGAPVAHEDDPARAVRCALGMQAALRRISADLMKQHGVTLQIRIGLNLGTVVVGDIGADLKMNYTAMGDTVNVAARLQSVAEPGTILASRAVYEQTRALFEFRELGSIRVKGRVEPVEIFEITGARRTPGRVRGIPGLNAPMIGRAAELAQLKSAADDLARHGRGGILLVTGEAGLGKTRLKDEFKRLITPEPLRVIEANCIAYGTSPYDVFVKLLSAYLDISADDQPSMVHAKIEKGVFETFDNADTANFTLPYLENLFGLHNIDRVGSIRHLDPSQLRQQTFLAIRDFFNAACRHQPLVLIFEDVHWVDKPSLDLLLFLSGAVENAPLLFVCLARPGDNQAAPQIERVASSLPDKKFAHLSLEPLSLEETTVLLDLLLTLADLPETLRRLIPRRAEGNPFFLEEIIRMLIGRDIIERRGDRWEMAPGADLQTFQVPRTLESLIMTRVDNLPESARFTAQCAAVIGSNFSHELLRRVADGASLGGVPMRPDNDIRELIEADIVRQVESRPDRQYVFRHILTQQTIYNGLLLRRREQLHHKIAAAIEDLYHDRLDEHVETLAYHYVEGQNAARALPYIVRSAERAAARYANDESLVYFRSALDLMGKADASLDQRVRIYMGLGDAQTFVGDYDGAVASLRTAWELTRAAPASPAQARQSAELARRLGRVYERRGAYEEAMTWLDSALRDVNRDVSGARAVERVRIYLDIGWVHYRRGNLEDAAQWRLRALELADGTDYYAEMGSAYNGLAAISSLQGDWQRAIEYALRGLNVRETIGDIEGLSRSHSNLGAIMMNVGDWGNALEHLQKSLELKQRIGDAKYLASAYNNLASYYLYKGDSAHARELFSASREHAEKIQDPASICLALNGLAEADLSECKPASAVELLRSSTRLGRETGAREPFAEALSILGQAELSLGHKAEAKVAAQQALELGQAMGIRQTEATAQRVLGSIERASGSCTEAEKQLSSSISIFSELKNPFETARSELELAMVYRAQGMVLDARALLAHCLDTFSRLGAASYENSARNALTDL